MNNSVRNLSAMNPEKNYEKASGSHITLLQINTLHCRQKELEHKGENS